MEVLVFQTNIRTRKDVAAVSEALGTCGFISRWTVDTDDCDRVLRVVAQEVEFEKMVQETVQAAGFECNEMPD